ncbi:MAG: DUF5696 domain-containing protein [Clostridium sp.]|jgi:hypothetical protein|nr:DUF5696 domain-containing protein [Clostridium sp.]
MKKDPAVRQAEFIAALKTQLKHLIVPALLLALIGAGVLAVMLWRTQEEPEQIIRVNAYDGEEEEIILENGSLKFVMDCATTRFQVTDKRTGQIWYSNPPDADDDPVALPTEKAKLKSTLLLTYSTVNGVDTVFDNDTYSMANGSYEIETGVDFVKVSYSIGDMEKEFVIPPVIAESDMEALLANMSGTDALTVKDYYKKYDIRQLGKNDDREELLARYPILEQEVVYLLRDTTKDNLKTKFEMVFEAAGYTYEDYLEDQELDLSEKVSERPVFRIDVVYRLAGNTLTVEVPMGEIKYREDYPLLTLNLLPYFGAGGPQEDGCLLVPEGGGSLIFFNNGKTAQEGYFANVYGWDMAQGRTALVHETRVGYGCFGIAKEGSSFLCTLEEGSPYASILADVSGRNNSYNHASASYAVLHREQYDVADKYNGKMFVYEDAVSQEHFRQVYRFVDSGGYVEMAKEYRGYLEGKYGDLLTLNGDTAAPVAVEIVGAVDKVEQVAGIPVSRPLALTRYQEAQDMIRAMTDAGLKNLSVKLSGWANGGIHQRVLNKVKPISRLGSKTDLKNLLALAKEKGVRLYLDGITSYSYDSDFLDGFLVFRDAARMVSKERAKLEPFSTVWYGEADWEDSYDLLRPSLTIAYMDRLAEAARSYGGAGVSFRDVGMDLSADYNQARKVSRQQAQKMQEEKLLEIRQSGIGIMINGGNDYAIAYSDFVTNMDLEGSQYSVIDRNIPFFQLAIHGYVSYAGEPLNLAGDYREELLRSAEYGAGLSFVYMQAENTVLQNTYYSEYFGAEFAAWSEKMAEICGRYEEELGHTYRQRIVDHQQLGEDGKCTATTYEDGTVVYVNYHDEDYAAGDGITVPARDYVVLGKEG